MATAVTALEVEVVAMTLAVTVHGHGLVTPAAVTFECSACQCLRCSCRWPSLARVFASSPQAPKCTSLPSCRHCACVGVGLSCVGSGMTTAACVCRFTVMVRWIVACHHRATVAAMRVGTRLQHVDAPTPTHTPPGHADEDASGAAQPCGTELPPPLPLSLEFIVARLTCDGLYADAGATLMHATHTPTPLRTRPAVAPLLQRWLGDHLEPPMPPRARTEGCDGGGWEWWPSLRDCAMSRLAADTGVSSRVRSRSFAGNAGGSGGGAGVPSATVAYVRVAGGSEGSTPTAAAARATGLMSMFG